MGKLKGGLAAWVKAHGRPTLKNMRGKAKARAAKGQGKSGKRK